VSPDKKKFDYFAYKKWNPYEWNADPQPVQLTPGKRKKLWSENVINPVTNDLAKYSMHFENIFKDNKPA